MNELVERVDRMGEAIQAVADDVGEIDVRVRDMLLQVVQAQEKLERDMTERLDVMRRELSEAATGPGREFPVMSKGLLVPVPLPGQLQLRLQLTGPPSRVHHELRLCGFISFLLYRILF